MCICICIYIYIYILINLFIYIPLPGGSFDVGGALSKLYAREKIYAQGQKLVLSSSFSSDEERRRFSFLAVLDTWLAHGYKSIIATRPGAMAEYMHSALRRYAPLCVVHIFLPYIYIY